MPRKKKETRLNVKMDKDLYDFFQAWCAENQDTMSGYIKRHILKLKRNDEAQRSFKADLDRVATGQD